MKGLHLLSGVSVALTVLLSFSTVHAQTAGSPSLSPAPAPAPAFVNISQLLGVAGPFGTFLDYLESSKVMDTFQNQANDTEEGITIFVPKNEAFASLKKKKPSLSNLTQEQLKSFLLFHALPHYYSLSDFKNLSQSSPVPTLAGGKYSLNFTDASGTVHMSSGWTDTKVSSSVHSTDPIAIYQIDRVLLPEAIFGAPPPPSPAPAPAPSPDIAPVADSPVGDDLAPTSTTPSSSSHRILTWGVFNCLVLIVSGGWVLFL